MSSQALFSWRPSCESRVGWMMMFALFAYSEKMQNFLTLLSLKPVFMLLCMLLCLLSTTKEVQSPNLADAYYLKKKFSEQHHANPASNLGKSIFFRPRIAKRDLFRPSFTNVRPGSLCPNSFALTGWASGVFVDKAVQNSKKQRKSQIEAWFEFCPRSMHIFHS